MAEGFELVRTVRQHLRRSATLLDQGKFDEALAEAESALALDPQSLPAQAMRDRIWTAKAGKGAAAIRTDQPTSRSFVPHGVNAASWRGFEQRITERRFRALLDTINTSIVASDARAAQAALDEARELRPDAPVLAEFEARVAAVPVAIPPQPAKAAARIWMRAVGAAALFLIGVSLMLGIEWMRPENEATTAPPVPIVAPEVPAVAPTQDTKPVPSPELGPVPVAVNEEESVPAIITPPEPLLRPTATTGSAPPPLISSSPIASRDTSPPVPQRMAERQPVEEEQPNRPVGEVADDFVATPSRSIAAAAPDAGPAIVTPSAPVDTPVNADGRGRAPAPAATASAVTIPSTTDQQLRVEEVLRRYARAYGQLDATAARAVWPTVDERALARAFQNLSSQKVSFDGCQIDIRGVVANAACRGQASYTPKVGKREARTESRNWNFELRREGDAWQIVDVDARRQSTLDYR